MRDWIDDSVWNQTLKGMYYTGVISIGVFVIEGTKPYTGSLQWWYLITGISFCVLSTYLQSKRTR